ncbi:MAG TPA: LamG domain-containing protein [Acidimicrobiales bacterium]|nr:LamG domain-containing protein [Acidimicrobiales bacterium]
MHTSAQRGGWRHVTATIVGGAGLAALITVTAQPAGAGRSIGSTYAFSEGTGQITVDRSTYHLDGVLGSSDAVEDSDPTWIKGASRSTKALHFDGGDFVTVPDSPALEGQRITVGAVVRATAPGAYRYVLSKGAVGCEMASYGLYTAASGGLTFYVSNGWSFTSSPDAGPALWDGAWHTVYGTYDGATVRLYVDGVQVGDGTASTITVQYGLAGDNRVFIGNFGGACASPPGFVGDIDSAAVLHDVVRWSPPRG